MNPRAFVSAIQELKFDHVFNPYSDRCGVHDIEDAPLRRAHALLELLEAAVETWRSTLSGSDAISDIEAAAALASR